MGKERSALEGVVATIDALTQGSEDVEMLVSLAVEGEDEETFHEAETELDALEKKYKEDHRLIANALSFGDYGKAGGSHV